MTRARALQWLARLGYGARGVVYLLFGGLATAAALSDTRPPTLRGALSTVLDHPFGWLALAALAGGLFGYAAWRTAQAVLDLRAAGAGAAGLAARAGLLASAALHASLGLSAAAAAADWDELAGGGAGASAAEAWAALVLAWPLGRWLLGLAGAAALALGGGEFAKARRGAFGAIEAPERAMRLIRPLGRLGLAAKGAVLGLVGALLVVAAWRAEAEAAGGARAALATLDAAPVFGDGPLLAVAAGLGLYGAFSVVEGWCHRLPAP